MNQTSTGLIRSLTLKLELFTSLVPIPSFVYFIAVTGAFHKPEQLQTVAICGLVCGGGTVAWGILVRIRRIRSIFRDLDRLAAQDAGLSAEDKIKIKLKVLHYPYREGRMIIYRWVIGYLAGFSLYFLILGELPFEGIFAETFALIFVLPISFVMYLFVTEGAMRDLLQRSILSAIEVPSERVHYVGYFRRLLLSITSVTVTPLAVFAYLFYVSFYGKLSFADPLIPIAFLSSQAVLSMLIVAYVVARAVKGGLFATNKILKALGEGEFNVQSARTSTDEFGEQGHLLGIVVSKLRHVYDQINSMNENLEIKIEEKTNELRQTLTEVEKLKLEPVGNASLVYKSQIMHKLMENLDRVAKTPRPVLITGETGTGKELIAKLIAVRSLRPESPFVAINCAAVPASLWEDELFGHAKGAYTDARVERIGRIAEAADGTLFFDEIGELPIDIQPKLLRVLQENQFSAVGANGIQESKCRFVFATNRDLNAMMEAGQFRSDLYYRIASIQLQIPPLRQRRVDISAIADYFLSRFEEEFGPPHRRLETEALEALINYRWPGNIRELENVLVRAVLRTPGEWILRSDLDELETDPMLSASQWEAGELELGDLNFDERVNTFKRRIIQTAITQANGNKSRAAELLGIGRGRLRSQLAELGLE